MSISGFVQAGGKSRRMGQNKALLKLDGRALIEHSLAVLSPLVSQLGIITNNPELYQYLNIVCYPDKWPGVGPLAGIGAALERARHDYSLVLACDMPFVRASLFAMLIEQGKSYQICVPQAADGQLQPLCALYHRSCQPIIEESIARGEYAPRQLFDKLNTRILPFQAFAELKNADYFFENLNTPEDFARANSKGLSLS